MQSAKQARELTGETAALAQRIETAEEAHRGDAVSLIDVLDGNRHLGSQSH